MENKKEKNVFLNAIIGFAVILVIFYALYTTVYKDEIIDNECFSLNVLEQKCIFLNESINLVEANETFAKVAYLSNWEYRSIVEKDTLVFSFSGIEDKTATFKFINNTKKIVYIGD